MPRRRPLPPVVPPFPADPQARALLASLTDVHLRLLHSAMRDARTTEELRDRVRRAMGAYVAAAAPDAEGHLDRLFDHGFRTGAADAAGHQRIDQGDRQALEWLKTNPIGFLSALGDFGRSEARWLDAKTAGLPLEQAKAVVAKRAADAAYKLVRIVRTDRQKATALGRLLAWRDDPQRDFYHYGWFPMHDDREKDVSLLFERRNPMTYWQLRKTFEVDHVIPKMVVNRKTGRREAQVSAFNCRCEVARWPKTRRQLVDEGLIPQEQETAA